MDIIFDFFCFVFFKILEVLHLAKTEDQGGVDDSEIAQDARRKLEWVRIGFIVVFLGGAAIYWLMSDG